MSNKEICERFLLYGGVETDSKGFQKEVYECKLCNARVTRKTKSGFTNLMSHLKEPSHDLKVKEFLDNKANGNVQLTMDQFIS